MKLLPLLMFACTPLDKPPVGSDPDTEEAPTVPAEGAPETPAGEEPPPDPASDDPQDPDEPTEEPADPAEPADPPQDPADTGDPDPVLDCSGLAAEGFDVCVEDGDTCEIVFYDGTGCSAACASAGMECVASYRDDDDGAPQCDVHPSNEAFYCSNTGHQSDYCVCAPPADPVQTPPTSSGGTPTCHDENPTFNGTVDVDQTIVITEPGVYDYGNVLHRWTGSGNCDQIENQPYILRIAASNVTVRNFAYVDAPDGIHIGTADDGQGYSYGDYITNIVLENVTGTACEDAMTVQYGVDQVTIRDSVFFPNPNPNYRDKLLQLNFGNVTVESSTFYGGAPGDATTCIMYKGNQDIVVRDSCFVDCDRATAGSTITPEIGLISHDPSTLVSENNVGYNFHRRYEFWDPWKLHHGVGDITGTTWNDDIRHGGINWFEDGAQLTWLP